MGALLFLMQKREFSHNQKQSGAKPTNIKFPGFVSLIKWIKSAPIFSPHLPRSAKNYRRRQSPIICRSAKKIILGELSIYSPKKPIFGKKRLPKKEERSLKRCLYPAN